MNQAKGGPTPPIRGQAAALLVIDVQQGLFRKSTPIFRAEPLLDTITALVERAHAATLLVVYIQHASDKVLPFGSADWQLHPRLHPGEGDLIVHKQHGNAFEDTSLHRELAARRRTRHRDRPGDPRLRQSHVRRRAGAGLHRGAGCGRPQQLQQGRGAARRGVEPQAERGRRTGHACRADQARKRCLAWRVSAP